MANTQPSSDMARQGVVVLKFLGTVTLGMLSGMSYTLSTLTVPTLLGLPDATSSSKTLGSVSSAAALHLNALRYASGSCFLAAFALSPSALRHPYMLYAAGLAFGSELVEFVPGFGTAVGKKAGAAGSLQRAAAKADAAAHAARDKMVGKEEGEHSRSNSSHSKKQQKKSARNRDTAASRSLDASYEVLSTGDNDGDDGDDDQVKEDAALVGDGAEDVEEREHAEAAAAAASIKKTSSRHTETSPSNNESVKQEVNGFLRGQVLQGALAGTGFVLAVIGLWGDGA